MTRSDPSDVSPGVLMRRASTADERTAAARALVGRRKRVVLACELCEVFFETYAKGTFGVARFCSPAHQRRAYFLSHRELERERDRQRKARRRATKPTEKPCVQCKEMFPISRRAIYCGRACRWQAYAERKRGASRSIPPCVNGSD